jgi:hypothetical protein
MRVTGSKLVDTIRSARWIREGFVENIAMDDG